MNQYHPIIGKTVALSREYLDDLKAQKLYHPVDDLLLGKVLHWVSGSVYNVEWPGRANGRMLHIDNMTVL